ncbi:MAG: DMT family transporter [Paracoccaceae bacterium]
MNQIPQTATGSPAMRGAIYMVLAGMAFAVVNTSNQMLTMKMGVDSTTATFWEYFIAVAFSAPVIFRYGLKRMKTDYLLMHIIRIILAVLGIQLWIRGLAHVEIWQAIALIMTSPFFVTIGAMLFLKENVSVFRWIATAVGFAGGLIILEPWSSSFSPYTLLPVGAAILWAGTSLLTKRLTAAESAEKVTVYLLALLLPVNAVFAGAGGGFAVLAMNAVWLILLAGLLTAFAQFILTRAYEVADASYVQPFDHLKLPFNVLAGWVVFGYLPTGNLWIGAAMIIGASLYIMQQESREAA